MFFIGAVPQRRRRPKPRRGAAAVAVRTPAVYRQRRPAPVVASSRNAKQNMTTSSPPLPPSCACVWPEARRLAALQRRPVLVEVREGHLAGSDESRYPREQSDDDQQAEDEFDHAGEPERPCSDRHGFSQRPAKQLHRAVQHIQQTEDDPERCLERGRSSSPDGYRSWSSWADLTPKHTAISQRKAGWRERYPAFR